LHEANRALVSNEESLRQLSARLLQLQDEDRRHIARDLHDITGQKLVIQSLQLARILRENRHQLKPGARRMLSECARLNKEIGGETRTLSYLLHPPLLDELGLPAAARWYADGFQNRTGITLEVEIPSELPRLPPEVEMSLFRVIQESLTNVHRYSESSKAVVRIQVSSDQLRLEIRDFGKGLKPGALSASRESTQYLGVGIQGMRERLRQLQGKLEIFSEPNQGTQVVATLPLFKLEEGTERLSISIPGPSISAPEPAGGPERRKRIKRILIADDHEVLRRGLRATLETQKEWKVCGEAANGKDAVEMVLALKPDLVILDINMPVLNGLAASREILRRQPRTKILMFTVHESMQTVREIRATGAHGYLAKNKAGRDLLRMVRELLMGKSTPMAAPVSSIS
jgi:CheY-like chemotaxis protein